MTSLLRFLFGHGWWIAWHVVFWIIVLFFVGLILLMFGQDLKKPGEKPDLASPGSVMVFMIALALALLTLIDGIIYAVASTHAAGGAWWKVGLAIVASVAILFGVGWLNSALATQQSRGLWHANLWTSVAIVIGNLALLWNVHR